MLASLSIPAFLLLTLVVLAVACGDTDGTSQQDFGPLAVSDNPNGDDASGGTGPIDIGEDCVTMTSEYDQTFLLVWYAPDVSWDEEIREITYSRHGATAADRIVLRDGDFFSVGGSSLISDQLPTPNLTWLATPHATCGGEPWSISDIRKQ